MTGYPSVPKAAQRLEGLRVQAVQRRPISVGCAPGDTRDVRGLLGAKLSESHCKTSTVESCGKWEVSDTGVAFSPRVTFAIHDGERKMRRLIDGANYKLYNYLHITMGKLWPVDSFYIGFFQKGNIVTFPYNFDNNRYCDPNFHTYGENGICAWVIKHRRPYTFDLDQGALLNRGYLFGDVELRSKDAVVMPLIIEVDRMQRVIGNAAIQSYQSGVYDDETVAAFWRLTQTMMSVLTRKVGDDRRRDELAPGKSLTESRAMSMPELVEEVGGKLQALREGIEGFRGIVPSDDHHLLRAVRNVGEICNAVQTETFELLVRRVESSANLLARLTSREWEVATLVAQGCNNKEIARRLYIAELTAKTHVSRILRKIGAGQRSEITAKIRLLSELM